MKVYSLTGPAGTGKSYQAMALCQEKNIVSIIDDGLFIFRNKVEAGISAKRQKTKVGAIKTALFTTDEHCDSVRRRIRELEPESILVIGTSDKMADRIVARLELPAVSERIHIEDITTEEDRKIAERQRTLQGKHVIPVPTLQLKRDFAGYFMDPLKIFRSGLFGGTVKGEGAAAERTVVRPTYSYLGEFYISDKVISDIAQILGRRSPGVDRVLKIYENTAPDSLNVEVSLAMSYSPGIWEHAADFQHELAKQIESMTAFNVVRVNVDIKQIV